MCVLYVFNSVLLRQYEPKFNLCEVDPNVVYSLICYLNLKIIPPPINVLTVVCKPHKGSFPTNEAAVGIIAYGNQILS